WFIFAITALVVFKFWLIRAEEIYGYTTEYDCLWFLRAAKDWYWGMPYDWTALFRLQAYPLFIPLVHSFGVPLRIAIELLQIGGYLFFVLALRKANVPRVVSLSIFAVCLLHP